MDDLIIDRQRCEFVLLYSVRYKILSTAFCTVVLVIYSGSTDMEMLDMNMANGENE